MKAITYHLKKTDEIMASQTGLMLVESLLHHSYLEKRLKGVNKKKYNGFSDAKITKSMLALLTMGKTKIFQHRNIQR